MAIQSLSREEIYQLLKTAHAARTRDWLMILMAFYHGLRASELIALSPHSFNDGFITVQRLKGSNKTVQKLIEHEDPLLNETSGLFDYIKGMREYQKLFPMCRQTFWRMMQRHAKASGLPAHKRNTKMLKHSIAMQTIQSAGIENVRVHLGHKSISSTGEYLKVSEADAGRAVRAALKD